MSELLHQLVEGSARRFPSLQAISHKSQALDYHSLLDRINRAARGLATLGLKRGERIGIYLEKRIETVVAIFGAAAAGCVFVPINPVLKPRQVGYIMRDCNVRLLVTSRQRAADLEEEIQNCGDLRWIVLVDGDAQKPGFGSVITLAWRELMIKEETG